MTQNQKELLEFLEETEQDPRIAKLEQQVKHLENQLNSAPSFDDFPTLKEQLKCHSEYHNKADFREDKMIKIAEPGCSCNSAIFGSVCPTVPPLDDPGKLLDWQIKHLTLILEIGSYFIAGYHPELTEVNTVKLFSCKCNDKEKTDNA